MKAIEIDGVRVAELAADGPKLDSEQAALDAMGEAYGVDFDVLAIPKARLSADFLVLRTGLLGAVTQKFTNYQMRVAFVGDFAPEITASNALRDYVRETNKGRAVLFAADLAEVARLSRR